MIVCTSVLSHYSVLGREYFSVHVGTAVTSPKIYVSLLTAYFAVIVTFLIYSSSITQLMNFISIINLLSY